MSPVSTLMYSVLLAITLWAGACRSVLKKSRPFLDDVARYSDDVAHGADDAAKLADDAANLAWAEKSLIRKAIENQWDDIVVEVLTRVSDSGLDLIAIADVDPVNYHIIRISENTRTSHVLRIPRYLFLAKDDEGNNTLNTLYLAQEDPALLDAMMNVDFSR